MVMMNMVISQERPGSDFLENAYPAMVVTIMAMIVPNTVLNALTPMERIRRASEKMIL